VSDPILSSRSLNRTLLARQHLLERATSDFIGVMEEMGGVQTQSAPSGYIGLWSRTRAFERPMLTRALEERRAIQGTIMRATIHTVSAADYWPMTVGVRRVRREWFERVSRRDLERLDTDAVARSVREELAAGPLPMRTLTERMVARGFPPEAARWAGTWVDLVRVPPSGTWERRRADLYGLAETWLPPDGEVTEEAGIAHLVRRYLGGFGPAPLRDIASWMGVKVGDVRPVVDGMELRTYRDEDGGDLLDLPDMPVADEAAPAPPRFLPVWDATLLVHARRTQILPEAYRPLIFNTRTPQSVNTFLLDGQVAGTWRFADGEVELSPQRDVRPDERAGLEEEAHRLAAFHA
jgi:hypothetical protein